MKLRYMGDATIRVGTEPVSNGDYVEVDEATGLELRLSADFSEETAAAVEEETDAGPDEPEEL